MSEKRWKIVTYFSFGFENTYSYGRGSVLRPHSVTMYPRSTIFFFKRATLPNCRLLEGKTF